MAIRKKLSHDMKTREKIQTSQIINRLEKHILAKPKEIDGKVVIKNLMTQSQVSAALGLIKKTLPDLVAVEHSGEVSTNNATELTEEEILQRISELRAESTDGAIEAHESKEITH